MASFCKIENKDCLDQAGKVILNGGILVYPTDTLYGFGVDPRSRSALERLSLLKGRGGPWSIAVSSLEMAKAFARIPQEKLEFAASHLPGKVTLILKAQKTGLSSLVLGPGGTVGIRIPGHFFPVQLTATLKFPITTTSVNRTGNPPLNDPYAIGKEFGNEVDLIVDAGPLPPSKGSTLYDLTGKKIKVVRRSS